MPRRGRAGSRVTIALLSVLFGCTAGIAGLEGSGHSNCTDCHLRSSAGSAPTAQVCLSCHRETDLRGETADSQVSTRSMIRYGHVQPFGTFVKGSAPGGEGSVDLLICANCHDPHDPDSPAILREIEVERPGPALNSIDRVSRQCVGCHVKMARFKGSAGHFSQHPIGIPSARVSQPGVPVLPLFDVKGTLDISDDVIGCPTCHFVHSGPNRYLLRWAREDTVKNCGVCHSEGRPGGDAKRDASWAKAR